MPARKGSTDLHIALSDTLLARLDALIANVPTYEGSRSKAISEALERAFTEGIELSGLEQVHKHLDATHHTTLAAVQATQAALLEGLRTLTTIVDGLTHQVQALEARLAAAQKHDNRRYESLLAAYDSLQNGETAKKRWSWSR